MASEQIPAGGEGVAAGHPGQWFSNPRKGHLEGLFQPDSDPTLRAGGSVDPGEAQEFLSLTKSPQVRLPLLSQGPHLESHWSQEEPSTQLWGPAWRVCWQ